MTDQKSVCARANTYTGVSLNTLANLVGGLNSSEVLMVNASDGYHMNFTLTLIAVVSSMFLGRKSPKKRFFTKQGEGT
jgi:putative heme iron utilization protein